MILATEEVAVAALTGESRDQEIESHASLAWCGAWPRDAGLPHLPGMSKPPGDDRVCSHRTHGSLIDAGFDLEGLGFATIAEAALGRGPRFTGAHA